MILSPPSYLHIKALIKICRERNTLFKTNCEAPLARFVFLFQSFVLILMFSARQSFTSPKYIFADKRPENAPSVLNAYKCVIFRLG